MRKPASIATVLLVLAVIASFIACVAHARRQFQEMDSYLVVDLFQEPLSKSVNYVGWSYKPTEWSGQAAPRTAGPLLGSAIDKAPDIAIASIMKTSGFKRYHDRSVGGPLPATTAEARAFLAHQISVDPKFSSLPLHGVYRLGLITAIGGLNLPKPLEGAILLPLGTTYSLGPGLIYGLVDAVAPAPMAFMYWASIVTLLVFHAAAAAQYFLTRRLGVGAAASALAALWFLFATNHFQYAFHLGSTIWMVAASTVFLWVLARHFQRGGKGGDIGLAAGVLIFFHYLVVIYYGAFLLYDFIRRWRAEAAPGASVLGRIREAFGVGFAILRVHWLGLALVFGCALLFFQPGQGQRGVMASLSEAPTYLAYSVATLFGVNAEDGFTGSYAGAALQAAIALVVLAAGAVRLARATKAGERYAGQVGGFLLCLAGGYLIFMALGLVNVTPTRHILFLPPALFVLGAYGLELIGSLIARAFKLKPGAAAPATAVLVVAAIAGLAAEQSRLTATSSVYPTPLPSTDGAQHFAGVYGNASPVAWELGLPLLSRDAAMAANAPVLYADTDCDLACLKDAEGKSAGSAKLTEAKPLGDYFRAVKMNAFITPFSEKRFLFDRWNRLHLAAIRFAPPPQAPQGPH